MTSISGDMITNPQNSTRNSYSSNHVSKVGGYKINLKKSVALLYKQQTD